MAYIQTFYEGQLISEVKLGERALTIGRGSECDICIDNAAISSFHAIVSPENGSFVVEDAASTNGLLINGRRSGRHLLELGDEIELPKHTLRYVADGSGLTADATKAPDTYQGQSATFEVDVSELGNLVAERQRNVVPFLTVESRRNGSSEHALTKVKSTIGKGRECDLRTGGWLAPRVAATISRRADGFHLVPEAGARIKVNGAALSEPRRLGGGDRISVVDLTLTYNEPAQA